MENLLTIIGILVISTWLIVHYYKINETTPVSRYRESLLLLAMILFVFITRIPRIENIEHNVDTSVWIASILALKVFPDKLWVFLNYTDSRPLTVLPLYLVSLLGVEINYISTEIVAVVIWLTIGLILHKTFQLFISTELSLILVWLLWMVIATSHFSDYNVYNSEPPGILAITLCTYWYLKFRKTGRISPYKTVLLGFCLGSLPYIKFQNIPMGLVIGAFSLVAMAQLKYWKLIGLLILSALLPTLLMNIYYLMVGKLSDFWVNYFWNYYYYSYSTQFSSMPIYERFGWNRVKWFILSIETSKWFLRGLIACNIIFMFWWIKSKIDLFRFYNFSFAVLLVFTSFYAILQAGNDFPHYILYLFVPIVYLSGVLIEKVSIPFQRALVLICLILSISQATYNTCNSAADPIVPSALSKESSDRDKKIVSNIQAHSKPEQAIVVWGWVDRLYYLSNRANGYRIPHSLNMFLKSELYDYREKNFIEDMEATKPELVIDAMIPDYSVLYSLGKRFEEYPKISKYIHQHYNYLNEIDGVLFYVRKRH